MFITFEANEGAGKTTQVRLLADSLRQLGHDVITTREPGGSPGAEELRNIVVTGTPDRFDSHVELLIFNAARRLHLKETILPALEAGKIVICDRYLGSTLALQCAGGAEEKEVLALHQMSCFGVMPDLTFYLDIDPDVSMRRSLDRLQTEKSGEDRFESKGQSFHRKVSDLFEAQVDRFNWMRINADQNIEIVQDNILKMIKPHLLSKAS
jgi:dTMP kinase